MIHDIKITMVRPSTKSRGWHKRRLQGMLQTVIRCLAFTDPFEFSQNGFDFKIDTDIQTDVPLFRDTYILKVTLELDEWHLEQFTKYLKNIRGLNTITLLSAPNHGTIST
jgi:hypothetical protein